jgi:hypothetical protein
LHASLSWFLSVRAFARTLARSIFPRSLFHSYARRRFFSEEASIYPIGTAIRLERTNAAS